jgi:Flp pilus assembly protein TadG
MSLLMMKFLRKFRGDARGVSAVEFAFIAPIMIAMYFSMAELCQGMFAERRTSHVASAVGDLVTQSTSVTTTGVADIFSIGNSIMAPFATTTLKMCVSSITSNASTGKLGIDWVIKDSSGGPAKKCTDTSDFPTQTNGQAFLNKGDSIVLSRSEYTYKSPVAMLLPKPITFKEAFYLRPRKSVNVTCSYPNGSACPTT